MKLVEKLNCLDNLIYITTNTVEVLISKALIDSVISHDEIFLINNVLKEYNEMKKDIKNLPTPNIIKDFSIFIKQCYHIV